MATTRTLLDSLTETFSTLSHHGEMGKAARIAELIAALAEREVARDAETQHILQG